VHYGALAVSSITWRFQVHLGTPEKTEANMAVLSAKSDLQVSKDRAAHRVFPVTAKLTKEERRAVTDFAQSQGLARGQWMREVILRELREVSLSDARKDDDALFTELIATRMLMVNLLKPLILGKQVSQDWITEAMAAVRREKRKAARDLMQQYTEEPVGGQ
jgi:hypothetical protein